MSLNISISEEGYKRYYQRWTYWMSVINIIGVGLCFFIESHELWLAFVTFMFGSYVAFMPRCLGKMPSIIGYANWVTIFRLCMILFLFGMYPVLPINVLFAGFLLAICLDGVDGFLARKFNQASQVGGNLDMETDAFLVLAMSWIHIDQGRVGWWLLIPGAFRYVYRLGFSWSNYEGEFLPKKVRASIAVVFFMSLAMGFILPQTLANYLFVISSALIGLSFAFTIYFDFKSL